MQVFPSAFLINQGNGQREDTESNKVIDLPRFKSGMEDEAGSYIY